jgi:hypothetical protein
VKRARIYSVQTVGKLEFFRPMDQCRNDEDLQLATARGQRDGERTTEAKIAAVAKSELPKPSRSPTATVSAVTVAECDDGIPPDPTSCFGSHRFSLYLRAADPVTESSDLPTTDGPARPATSVPCGEDLDRLGDGEHRGDERAVGEHGEVGERGRAGGGGCAAASAMAGHVRL